MNTRVQNVENEYGELRNSLVALRNFDRPEEGRAICTVSLSRDDIMQILLHAIIRAVFSMHHTRYASNVSFSDVPVSKTSDSVSCLDEIISDVVTGIRLLDDGINESSR